MSDPPQHVPLKSLHTESILSAAKLEQFERLLTEVLLASLLPGQPGCLKTRPDGTILDGHYRICVLRRRSEDVDHLPREVVIKESE